LIQSTIEAFVDVVNKSAISYGLPGGSESSAKTIVPRGLAKDAVAMLALAAPMILAS
jgi:hypothetical protein